MVTILESPCGYEICYVEDEAFYDLATPTYEAIQWEERAKKGGDGNPLPDIKLKDVVPTGVIDVEIEEEEDLEAFLKVSQTTNTKTLQTSSYSIFT